jgi:hypothetical protein
MTKAEYRVLIDASKDILYLRHLLTELGLEPNGATPYSVTIKPVSN